MAFREPAQSHNDYLREHDVARARFNKLAMGLGYDGSDYLEAAAWIALRCASAEQALRRSRSVGLPGLTPAETERLAMLAETCGEVVQAVGKVLRHGWESQSPYGGRPNRVSLEREIGQVRAIVNLMLDSGDVEAREAAGLAALEAGGAGEVDAPPGVLDAAGRAARDDAGNQRGEKREWMIARRRSRCSARAGA